MSKLKKYYLLLFTILTVCLFPFVVYSHNPADKSIFDFYNSGRTMQKIDSLISVYPDDYRFQYEKSLLYIENSDIYSAKKILDSLFLSGVKDENVYQLLINCNVQVEHLLQADFVLDSALYYFPESSKLNMEKGYRFLDKEKLFEASDCFEKGIRYDPYYSENYYPLISYYKKLDIRLFPILYGEIFINLSIKDSLTKITSIEIYSILENSISKDKKTIKLTNIDYFYDPGKIDSSDYSFEIASQILMQHSLNKLSKKKINFSLDFIYNLFDEFHIAWDKSIYSKNFKHPIYEYHSLLAKNNLLKPYIYLIYSQGNIDEFNNYLNSKIEQFQKLLEFMNNNKLKFNKDHRISRSYFNY